MPCKYCDDSHSAFDPCPEIIEARRKAEANPTPCELCKTPTPMLGTKRCDSCWEFERRIRAHPEIALAILSMGAK